MPGNKFNMKTNQLKTKLGNEKYLKDKWMLLYAQ